MWVPISRQLASVRLKRGEGEVSLTVVAAYAPILDAEYGEAKGSIYDGLQDAVDRVLAGDIRIVSGDGNTRQVPWTLRPRRGQLNYDTGSTRPG